MKNKERLEVILAKENADGSAVYTFDIRDDEDVNMFTRQGIVYALRMGLRHAAVYDPFFDEFIENLAKETALTDDISKIKVFAEKLLKQYE